MKDKNVIIVATTAYMINQFNKPNLELLLQQGYIVFVACNFSNPGPMPEVKVKEFIQYLDVNNITYFNVDIPRNPFNIHKMTSSLFKLKRIFAKHNFSIVHSHAPTGGVLARLAAAPYRKQGLKSVYTAHGFHFYRGSPLKMWFLFYPVEKFFSRITDILITINKEDYKLSVNKMKAKQNIYIPGVGVDIEKFSPLNYEEKVLLRKKLGYSYKDFILIYVGELNSGKNQKMIIEVIDQLKDKIPDLKLLLVGSGQKYDEYNRIIKNKGLEKSIELLGYRSDVDNLMSIANLAVSTSLREGLPMNVMEAMSTGLPVVLTDCRGNSDLMHGLQKEFVVDLNDTSDFSKKVLQMYVDSNMRNSLGTHNREYIEQYSLQHILEYFKVIYK